MMQRALLYRTWDSIVVLCAYLYALMLPASLVLAIDETAAYTWLMGIISLTFFADAAQRIIHWRQLQYLSPVEREHEPFTYSYSWFVIDAIAAIPFPMFPGVHLLRVVPLVKLLRVGQIMQFWLHREVHRAAVLRLIFFAFWLSIISHLFACGWIVIRGREHIAGDWAVYINALYWATQTLSTVGYGDITPETTGQQLYAIFCLVTGVGIYGYIIGNVTALVSRIDPAKTKYLESMERLTVFLNYHHIPPDLQQRARDYYSYMWDKRLGYSEADTISALPQSLQVEISLYIKRDIIEAVPIFKGAGEQFIREIALHLQPMVYLPGDYVVRAGEMGREMYFVSNGVLEVLGKDDDAPPIAQIQKGDFFGEVALFLNQPRNASVRVKTYCDIYRLDKEAFERILARYPAVAAQIEEKMRDRLQKAKNTSAEK